jgi:hypothetical protein
VPEQNSNHTRKSQQCRGSASKGRVRGLGGAVGNLARRRESRRPDTDYERPPSVSATRSHRNASLKRRPHRAVVPTATLSAARTWCDRERRELTRRARTTSSAAPLARGQRIPAPPMSPRTPIGSRLVPSPARARRAVRLDGRT